MTTTSSGALALTRTQAADRGYGTVTKALHWLTVLALLGQFCVGYAITRGGLGVPALPTVHLGLGLGILALAVVRLVWRLTTALPPWADQLSAVERKVAAIVERSLYVLLFAIPLTGLGLTFLSGTLEPRVLLGGHIAAHLAFFATLTVHLVLVGKNRLLSRML